MVQPFRKQMSVYLQACVCAKTLANHYSLQPIPFVLLPPSQGCIYQASQIGFW